MLLMLVGSSGEPELVDPTLSVKTYEALQGQFKLESHVTPAGLSKWQREAYKQLEDKSQWEALRELWHRESSWNVHAVNPQSGACGLVQALPCSKLPSKEPSKQIAWGLEYIQSRYKTVENALRFHDKEGWY